MPQLPSDLPTLDDVTAAAGRIAGAVHRTPVLTSESLDALTGAHLLFKCENLQKAGAFKIRGATNAVALLPEAAARRGVVTHSSGNHGAALALAARRRGVPATVVMPEDSARVKVAAVEGYGARIVFCRREEREPTAARVVEETGATLVHPYDDPAIVAGQATATLELFEQAGELDLLFAPVGGGGLVSGAALVAAERAPRCRVVAAEPAGANDAARSLAAGRRVPADRVETVADGLRAPLGEIPFRILRRHLDRVVTVGEAEIVAAMRLVWERMKLVVEPSAAVAVAAISNGEVEVTGRRVGVILSGGNVDLDRLPFGAAGGERADDREREEERERRGAER